MSEFDISRIRAETVLGEQGDDLEKAIDALIYYEDIKDVAAAIS